MTRRPPSQTRRTALPPPWRRIDQGTGKIGAIYDHPAGYRIAEAGGYWLYGPAFETVLAPDGGAFPTVMTAAVEVDRRLRAGAAHG